MSVLSSVLAGAAIGVGAVAIACGIVGELETSGVLLLLATACGVGALFLERL